MTRADDHNNGNCDGGAGRASLDSINDDDPLAWLPRSERARWRASHPGCLYCSNGVINVTVYAEDGTLRVDLARCPRCGGRG